MTLSACFICNTNRLISISNHTHHRDTKTPYVWLHTVALLVEVRVDPLRLKRIWLASDKSHHYLKIILAIINHNYSEPVVPEVNEMTFKVRRKCSWVKNKSVHFKHLLRAFKSYTGFVSLHSKQDVWKLRCMVGFTAQTLIWARPHWTIQLISTFLENHFLNFN